MHLRRRNRLVLSTRQDLPYNPPARQVPLQASSAVDRNGNPRNTHLLEMQCRATGILSGYLAASDFRFAFGGAALQPLR